MFFENCFVPIPFIVHKSNKKSNCVCSSIALFLFHHLRRRWCQVVLKSQRVIQQYVLPLRTRSKQQQLLIRVLHLVCVNINPIIKRKGKMKTRPWKLTILPRNFHHPIATTVQVVFVFIVV